MTRRPFDQLLAEHALRTGIPVSPDIHAPTVRQREWRLPHNEAWDWRLPPDEVSNA